MTLIEVLVVAAILALLVVLLLPALNRAKMKAQLITCNGNLKEINLSFKIWEGDNTNLYPMSVSTNFAGTLEYVATGQTFRHFQIMSNELTTPKILICPADMRQPAKDFGATFGDTNISYFVGVDAIEPEPPQYLFAQMFVCGDDNFAISGVPVNSGLLELSTNAPIAWTAARHKFAGNIGLADGSVQQLSQNGLRQAVQQTGVATNRLAIP
jgi:prepilin-type processing-associated H-X9-DG protein